LTRFVNEPLRFSEGDPVTGVGQDNDARVAKAARIRNGDIGVLVTPEYDGRHGLGNAL
jgi:hypothetical protein